MSDEIKSLDALLENKAKAEFKRVVDEARQEQSAVIERLRSRLNMTWQDALLVILGQLPSYDRDRLTKHLKHEDDVGVLKKKAIEHLHRTAANKLVNRLDALDSELENLREEIGHQS